jgi:hypothetical protein
VKRINTDDFDRVLVFNGKELVVIAAINTPFLNKRRMPDIELNGSLNSVFWQWREIQRKVSDRQERLAEKKFQAKRKRKAKR